MLWIEKEGRNTLDLVLDIARELGIIESRWDSRMKDKAAVTRQWICVSNKTPEELQALEGKLHHVKILDVILIKKNCA
jgi:tRNA pseudouridine13 synthase